MVKLQPGALEPICDFNQQPTLAMDIISDDDDYNDIIMVLFAEGGDSDLEDDRAPAVEIVRKPGGSRPGKTPNVERHHVLYSHLLFNDFWGESTVYSPMHFKRFFKLPIGLFDDIVLKVVAQDDYFRQKTDVAGRIGLSPLQKLASAVRLLTSGVSSNEHDDKYRMAVSTGLKAMKRFCTAVNAVYSADALRHPNLEDINRLLDEGRDAGFPGCIGSIDCMH